VVLSSSIFAYFATFVMFLVRSWEIRSFPERHVGRNPRLGYDRAMAGAEALLHIERRKVGDILVVTMAGRITESFDGKALGRELAGTVILDVGGVKSVTSYGVRTWLEMLATAQDQIGQLYLARCSQAVVTQLNMVGGFSGGARVISFYTPYRCQLCAFEFEKLFDCELDAESIRNLDPPHASCPQCTLIADVDEDTLTYFGFFVRKADERPVPEQVRRALDEARSVPPGEPLPLPPPERVEKTVEGTTTRLRVHQGLVGSMRWERIVQGLEGDVVFDFSDLRDVTGEGWANFERTLRRLPDDVARVEIEGCPQLGAEHLSRGAPLERVTVTSAIVEGTCGRCMTISPAKVDARAEGPALATGHEPKIACDRCDGPLSLARSIHILVFLGRQPGITGVAPRRGTRRRLIAIACVIGVAGGVAIARMATSTSDPPSSPQVAQPQPQAPAPAPPPISPPVAPAVAPRELLPPWVERTFVIEGDHVLVVGRGGPTRTEEEALAEARNDAIERLTEEMLVDLKDILLYELARAARIEDEHPGGPIRERLAKRYLDQVGAFATPERVDAVVRRRASGIEAFVRYKLSRAAFARAVQTYRGTVTFRGITVAPYFPQLEWVVPSDGAVVVTAVRRGTPAARAGVKMGNVVLEINGRRLYSTEDFATITRDEWSSTRGGHTIAFLLLADGGRTTFRMKRLVPARPKPPESPATPETPPPQAPPAESPTE
jgi:hypothetical protein